MEPLAMSAETPSAAPTLEALMTRHAGVGRVEWIGLRARRRENPIVVDEARAVAGRGLAGDHYRPGGKGTRQVTLIQAEHLAVVGALLGGEAPDPRLLRRNLLVSGINLLALKGRRFRVGAALLEGTGLCHPCSRMEEALGWGGYNAMRGHGGLTARILEGGVIRVGDAVGLAAGDGPSADRSKGD
jgi:MOSC domain-containing protein YiiM